MKKLFILFIAVAGFGVSSFAQQVGTLNGTATATIITPVTLAETGGGSGVIQFGNIAVGATPGTVVLPPVGVRQTTGGVSLPGITGTVAAAAFTITGEGANTFTLTLPSNAFTISKGGGINMTVTDFRSTVSPTSNTGPGTLVNGTLDITVGATLNVAAGQAAGSYVNAVGFPITVNYN